MAMASVKTQRTFSAGSEFPATTPGLLRIYSMRFCPYVHRTKLVLAHKNIEHETVNIHLKKKPDWFLAVNPFGLVPTLELDGKVLWESAAVCDWLDEVYPQNKLTPADPYRKARDRMLLEYLPKLVNSYHVLRGTKPGDLEQAVEDIHKHYMLHEEALAERGSRYFGGDQPAMIDFLIWPWFERIPAHVVPREPRGAVTKGKLPRLARWYEVMYETPAVKATMFENETHREYAKEALRGIDIDYDFDLKD